MDIARTVDAIDAEIATRGSDGFGIRMGDTLYRALFRSGHLTIGKFAIGSMPVPLYREKYGVYMDPKMPEEEFEVGMP